MSSVEVVEVESSAQLKKFIAYPNHLYRDDPNYVAPLNVERKEFFDFKKNPFYRAAKVKLFLAMDNGTVVGRIATCVNYRHNDFHDEKTGFFGFLDTPDDADIAAKLLKVAMITLKKEGMERMRGPMNFSTNHECGFLVEGFDSPPMVMMTYNKPYQPLLAEKFGMKKVMDLLAYKHSPPEMDRTRVAPIIERSQKRLGVTLRNMNMHDFDNEVALINRLYNECWSKNWGFVPMDEAEFAYSAKNLKQIVDPKLVIIAEIDGKPVAFALSLPNINRALIFMRGKLFPFGLLKLLWHTKIRNKVDTVRVITLGVSPEHQKKGLDSILYVATADAVHNNGYKWGELSWVLESNDLICRGLEAFGSVIYKRYRILQMPL
ncbi:MAG: GNAT family N-acetyltransferase [candidate division Zixibacteria bacterium]|nr:GNAT family N-acetyltransferase [candidate division Zixibacteria bacterium]